MEIFAAVARKKEAPFEISTLEQDEPRSDEVRVKIIATGICRTDIDVRDGYLPTPLPVVTGHEGAGIVDKVGADVKNITPGDHVILSLGSCGKCQFCIRGLPSFCKDHMAMNFAGARTDGSVCLHNHNESVHSHFFSQSSHASYGIVHHSSLVKVPSDVDLKMLGPLACGVMTGFGGVINTLQPKSDSSVAIFGMGTVGLSALMACNILKCSPIIVIDNKQSRLDLARELGATHTILSVPETNVVSDIQSITRGEGVQYAFESSGVKTVISSAFDSLSELGVLVMTGVLPQGEKVEFDAWKLLRGRRIIGSVMGDTLPATFIPRMVEYYRQGLLPLEKICQLYELKDINQAVSDMLSGKTVKAVITMPHNE